MTKWMTSGADRLKSKAARTFGARRGQKAAAAVAASRDPRARDSIAPSRAIGGGGDRGPRRNHGGRHQGELPRRRCRLMFGAMRCHAVGLCEVHRELLWSMDATSTTPRRPNEGFYAAMGSNTRYYVTSTP